MTTRLILCGPFPKPAARNCAATGGKINIGAGLAHHRAVGLAAELYTGHGSLRYRQPSTTPPPTPPSSMKIVSGL